MIVIAAAVIGLSRRPMTVPRAPEPPPTITTPPWAGLEIRFVVAGGTRFVVGLGLAGLGGDVDFTIFDAGLERVKRGRSWGVFDIASADVEAGSVPWAGR